MLYTTTRSACKNETQEFVRTLNRRYVIGGSPVPVHTEMAKRGAGKKLPPSLERARSACESRLVDTLREGGASPGRLLGNVLEVTDAYEVRGC